VGVWSVDEVAYAVDDSGTTVLLVDDALRFRGGTLRERCGGLEAVVFCGDGDRAGDTHHYEELVVDHPPASDARREGWDRFGVYTGRTTAPEGGDADHHNLLASTYGGLATWPMVGRIAHLGPNARAAATSARSCCDRHRPL